ncbi:hypothetical protein AB1I68_01050 [Paenibacillus pabuli]|uniref:hypothetical protein n=1 Tax=Paenibacillus pabuli TaxID=1472 RepID=UPI0034593B26
MLEGIKDSVGLIFAVGLVLLVFGLAIMFFSMMVLNIKDRFKRKPSSNRTRMFCAGCRNIISIDAVQCPHCGKHYGKSTPAYSSIIFCFIAGCGFLYLGLEGLILFLEEGFSYDTLSRRR